MSQRPKPPFDDEVEPANSMRATWSVDRPEAAPPPAEELAALLRIPPTDRRYRDACRHAITLATGLGDLRFELEEFLRPYLATRLTTAADARALFELGVLYERYEYEELARALYQRVLAITPEHEAAARLEALEPSPPSPRTERLHLCGAKTRERPIEQGGAAAPREETYTGPMPGAVLAKRYLLEVKIGRGATSVVFRAHDLEEQRAVAVKILTLPRSEHVQLERFKRELDLARRLVHRNVAALYDLDLKADPPFIVMELLVGRNLDAVVEERVPLRRAVDLLDQAAAGLGYAHDAGIIHRDVKSENLFVTNAGQIKVMDFGMAKMHGVDSLTAEGVTGGTPLYISPEQITDFRKVTHRADIYSLGVVAYELLTGRLPFEADQLVELLRLHLEAKPRDPRVHREDLPPRLAELVLAMLAKDPAKRVPDCGVVRARLFEALADIS